MENQALSISCVLLFEVGWGDIYPVSEGLTLTEVSLFLSLKRGCEGLERVACPSLPSVRSKELL